jgi:hypothetical protein
MELELLEGENVILEEVSFSQKVILTNMRVMILEKKGFFGDSFNMKNKIPLELIEEAYVKSGGAFRWSFAMLKMKNGESVNLGLKLPNSESFAADFGGEGIVGMHQRLKAINDSWVNAINSQLGAKFENRTQKLEDRIRELEEKLKEKEK